MIKYIDAVKVNICNLHVGELMAPHEGLELSSSIYKGGLEPEEKKTLKHGENRTPADKP